MNRVAFLHILFYFLKRSECFYNYGNKYIYVNLLFKLMKNDKNHCLYVKRPNIMILFMDLFLGLIEVICLNLIILGDNKQ